MIKFCNIYKFQLVLVLLPIFINLIWFKPGFQLAGGEESFSIFNSRDPFRENGIWEEPNTGYTNTSYLVRIPLSVFSYGLSAIGVEYWFTQLIVFHILLTNGLLSMFYLSKKLLKDSAVQPLFVFIVPLFYLFNLYSMSQVWGRFLYTEIFAWSYLPLFLLLLIGWIENKKVILLLTFAVSSLFFALVYHQPSNTLLLWFPFLIFIIVYLKQQKTIKKVFLTLGLAALAFMIWIVVNIWWIYPVFSLSSETFGEKLGNQANLDSLEGVSKYFPTSQILLLRQSFLLGPGSQYYDFYSNPWIYFVSIITLAIAVLGIIKSRRLFIFKFLMPLLIITWFICKGVNPPLGMIFYKFLFFNIPSSQMLRNPYEKLGLLLLLPYSIFFSAGLGFLYQSFDKLIRFTLLGIFLPLCLILLVWPMWSGDFFANTRVKIPEYYLKTNDFLNKQGSDARILVLPIHFGESAIYDWGYNGTEPSEFLFDNPAISRKVGINKIADDKYKLLVNAFEDDQDLGSLFEDLNIGFIIVHHDLYKAENNQQSIDYENKVKKLTGVRFIDQFGKLSLYSYENPRAGYFEIEGLTRGSVKYSKLSPVNYMVSIKNVDQPFNLIFKTSFSPGWSASINGEFLKDHTINLGYANSWKIEKLGDLEVNVKYRVWPWD